MKETIRIHHRVQKKHSLLFFHTNKREMGAGGGGDLINEESNLTHYVHTRRVSNPQSSTGSTTPYIP